MKKRVLSIIMVMAIIVSGIMIPSKAHAEKQDFVAAKGTLPVIINGRTATVEEQLSLSGASLYKGTAQNFPTSFDLRDYNLVTPVKSQGNYGTCWVFATVSSLESNALMMGYGEYDLSEYQLGYFASRIVDGQDDSIKGEGMECGKHWYEPGGYAFQTAAALMKGYGPVEETTCPYANVKNDLTIDYATQYNVLGFNGAYVARCNDIDAIKELITRNGTVWASVCSRSWDDSTYFNETYHAGYLPEWNDSYEKIDHAISIVGWDDNFSRDNFATKPKKDGAWIIKNSWGTLWEDEGYCYVSYYDAAFDADSLMYSYTVSPRETYDYIYQYDGGVGAYQYGISAVAMTVNAKDNQTITGVRIDPYNLTDATIKVYRDDKKSDIEANTCIYTQEVFITRPGYQTLELTNGVSISKGEKYYIVVRFDSLIQYRVSYTRDYGVGRKIIDEAKPDETYMLGYYSKFRDTYDYYSDGPCNVCIKAIVRNGHDANVIHRENIEQLPETSFWMFNNEEAKITVKWKEVAGAEGYKIYRMTNEYGGYELVATLPTGTLSYADTNLTIGNKYSYKVIAYAEGKIGSSKKKTLTATIKAPWIKSLKNSAKGQVKIECSWVKGATTYTAYRMNADKTFKYIGKTTNTKTRIIVDKDLKRNVTYSYKVRAINKNKVYSAFSAVKSVYVK